MPPRPDPARARAALIAQTDLLAGWLDNLDGADWATASVLPGWTVTVLTGHIVGVLRSVPALLRRVSPEPPLPLTDHFPPDTATPDEADRAEETAAWGTAAPADVLAEFHAATLAARAALAGMPPGGSITARRGPAALADVLLSRVWELAVHADDLGRSRPDRPAPPLDPGAVRIAARGFAELLAARAPGRSVELRVPPYVAVQCIPGPRHTRGTPPNVVETDPTTWLRLACGRVSWADQVATGTVRASGERSDLSGYLPLLG
ncbi:sterol carrier family protein [Pseudonocardia sp.]|uniref:maleylpyruvate isomerase family mycothiol-dependent enzyme n=1 Tax=Pseudonocardia sp. TaxID=60912 RepID=UPI0031FBB164